MFQDDVQFPGDSSSAEDFKRIPRFAKGHFALVHVTPHFLALVDATIARSADFDRSLAEQGSPKLSSCATLESYGDLVKAKGRLVEYVAALMDLARDSNLNRRRTAQVRFK